MAPRLPDLPNAPELTSAQAAALQQLAGQRGRAVLRGTERPGWIAAEVYGEIRSLPQIEVLLGTARIDPDGNVRWWSGG